MLPVIKYYYFMTPDKTSFFPPVMRRSWSSKWARRSPQTACSSDPLAPVYDSLICHAQSAVEKSVEMRQRLDAMITLPPGTDLDIQADSFMGLVAEFIAEHREMHRTSRGVQSSADSGAAYALPRLTTKEETAYMIEVARASAPIFESAIIQKVHSVASGGTRSVCVVRQHTLQGESTAKTLEFLCELLEHPAQAQRPLNDALWANDKSALRAVRTLSESLDEIKKPAEDAMPIPRLASVLASGKLDTAEEGASNLQPRYSSRGANSARSSDQEEY